MSLADHRNHSGLEVPERQEKIVPKEVLSLDGPVNVQQMMIEAIQ